MQREQISQCVQSADGEHDLFAQMETGGFRLQHPQRYLHRVSVGMANRRRIRGLPRPSEDFQRTTNKRMEGIPERHGGRHGI
jgi:hypothetical protein